MNRSDIQKIILDALVMTNHAREDNNQIPVSVTTDLYGANGHLDSMALVAFLIDIEEAFLDQNLQITLSDERAMSQTRSPFRNVESLTDYIVTLVKESLHV